jgi:hypothetical protein
VSVVIDASLTLTWYLEDEATPATDAILDRVSDAGAVVPILWRLEVANAFQSALRRKRPNGSTSRLRHCGTGNRHGGSPMRQPGPISR